jgi:ribosome-binding protein aMBF1 (putative translation factor)
MRTATSARKIKKTTTDVIEILNRQIANDPEMQEMVREACLNAEIAVMIYDARTKAKLTQAQLAKKIGTSQPVIARLEDADYEGHSLTMLRRIAEALNLRLEIGFAKAG